MIKFSVIMPAFNRKHFVSRAIKSVRLVNKGSVQIMTSYEERRWPIPPAKDGRVSLAEKR